MGIKEGADIVCGRVTIESGGNSERVLEKLEVGVIAGSHQSGV